MQNRQSKPYLFQQQQQSSPSPQSRTLRQVASSKQLSHTPTEYPPSYSQHQQRLASPIQLSSDLSPIEEAQKQSITGHPRYEVYMRCVTWSRDSHGLFDYESRYIQKKNIKTYTGGKIIRNNNNVEFIPKTQSAGDYGPTAKPLIIVHEKNGKFYVENDTLVAISQQDQEAGKVIDEDVNNKMFIVVRNLKTTTNKIDYKLHKGDIVKLGRIKFKVKDFRTENCPATLDNPGRRNSYSPVKIGKGTIAQGEDEYWLGGDDNSEEAIEIDCGVVDSTSAEIQCKVCWSNEQSPQNPLLNSCKCDGSVRFIHYECLKHWLKQKMMKKEETHLISYTWKQFECEICKKPYPYVFKSNGRKYRLVDVDVPEERNFLWLESLTFEKNSSRMVHIVMPDQERTTFRLGRGHESDVRVSDISVSRCHAILKFEDNQFYLEDNLSKFGTLVFAKAAIELEIDSTRAVQIGRSVISFTVKEIPPQSAVQTPSPVRQIQSITSHPATSVEELLRQKIEETDQKINRLMNQARVQPTSNQALSSFDVDSSSQSFGHSQTYHYPQSQDTNQHELASVNQPCQFVGPSSQQYNDRRGQQSHARNNQHELTALNSTLQRFEQMIQSVEQKLAEKEHKYQAYTQSYSSPARLNLREEECTPQKVEELRNQYRHQVMHNEWKYKQLLQNIQQNPETYESPNAYSGEQHLTTFSQLKTKYGKTPQVEMDSRLNLEDMKEESNDSFDGDDDDVPLRLRGGHNTNSHSVKNGKKEMYKYLNAVPRDASNDRNSGCSTQNHRPHAGQTFTHFGGSNIDFGTSTEGATLFSQIENKDKQLSMMQHSKSLLAHSPEKSHSQVQQQQASNMRQTSSSPWRMDIDEYQTASRTNKPKETKSFANDPRTYKNRISANLNTIEKIAAANKSPQKSSGYSALTPGKSYRGKDTSVDRTAKSNSYAAQGSSATKNRRTSGAHVTVTQTLYQRQQNNRQPNGQQTLERPQMRY